MQIKYQKRFQDAAHYLHVASKDYPEPWYVFLWLYRYYRGYMERIKLEKRFKEYDIN